MMKNTESERNVIIQLRKLDGSRMRLSLKETETISQLWDKIDFEYADVDRFQYELVQLYPRKIFGKEDWSSTLVSLGLVPTGNLGFEQRDDFDPKEKEMYEIRKAQESQKKVKRSLHYEKYHDERKKAMKEDKLIRENLLKEIKADREMVALRTTVVQAQSIFDHPDDEDQINEVPKSYAKALRKRIKADKVASSATAISEVGDNEVKNKTRIQFIKLDESKMTISLSDEKTILQLWDEIEARYKEVKRCRYCLVQLYPRKVFDGESLSLSLAFLGLSPSANLGFESITDVYKNSLLQMMSENAKKGQAEMVSQKSKNKEPSNEAKKTAKDRQIVSGNILKEKGVRVSKPLESVNAQPKIEEWKVVTKGRAAVAKVR